MIAIDAGRAEYSEELLENCRRELDGLAGEAERINSGLRMFSGMDSFRYMQVQVGHSHMVGSYHTTDMNHPIWILEVDLS